MISEWFYFTVRVGCTLYLLYRLWDALFRQRLFGIWDRLLEAEPPAAQTAEKTKVPEQSDGDVLGKTHLVYLEDPEAAATTPMRSEDLPSSDFIGEEEEIPEDAVEDALSDASSAAPPSEEELYEDAEQTPLDTEFSRGLTYDEISNAVGVLKTATADADKALAAARTIFNLKNTDLFEFFMTQVSNAEAIDKLLAESLDGNGLPLSPKCSTSVNPNLADFNWDHFV